MMWKYIKSNLEKNACSKVKDYNNSKVYTYIELLNKIENIGNENDLSMFSGAKCVILCKQTIESVKALLFCWKVGMIAIPLSFHYGKVNCRNIIDIVKPDIIISDESNICKEYEDILSCKLEEIELFKDIYILKEDMLQNVELMMCTSGTTGNPKVIMFSAKAIQKNIELILDYFTINNKDTMLICRPIYHCAVLVGELLLSFVVGTNIVLYSDGYNPFILASILKNNNITVMCGTPTIFKGISECLKHRNIKGKVKMIALSGEYLLLEYAQEIRKCFPEANIFNVYGLTEAGPRVSYLSPEMFDRIPQSVGKPLKGVKIKIVCENEEKVDKTKLGQIWIQTPSLMLGYYKDVEKTKEKIQKGWFATGDVGVMDEENNLYILGRSDDMIIKAGMNIYPQEVEKEILKLEDIKAVLVYGKLTEKGEEIIAEVILQDKYKVETDYDIMRKMSYILPEYMMPVQVLIVEDFIRNASGKIVRPAKKIRDI